MYRRGAALPALDRPVAALSQPTCDENGSVDRGGGGSGHSNSTSGAALVWRSPRSLSDHVALQQAQLVAPVNEVWSRMLTVKVQHSLHL